MATTIASVHLLFLVIMTSGLPFHKAAGIETEKLALLNLKQGLLDPSHRLSSWVGDDCCKWRGVVCSNRTGHVIKLSLRSLEDDGIDGKFGGEC